MPVNPSPLPLSLFFSSPRKNAHLPGAHNLCEWHAAVSEVANQGSCEPLATTFTVLQPGHIGNETYSRHPVTTLARTGLSIGCPPSVPKSVTHVFGTILYQCSGRLTHVRPGCPPLPVHV